MKVWELEEGKMYVCNNNTYRIMNGQLYYVFGKSISLEVKTFKDFANMDFKEYVEPVDWSKIKYGTIIEVRNYLDSSWKKRKFLCVVDGYVWTISNEDSTFGYSWKYARLKEDTNEK